MDFNQIWQMIVEFLGTVLKLITFNGNIPVSLAIVLAIIALKIIKKASGLAITLLSVAGLLFTLGIIKM